MSRPPRRKGIAEEVPELGEAYLRYRGLLFHALGILAGRGLPVPAGEGLDLVHDFFVDAWEGIGRRYDPSRARLSTYVCGAFLRYAVPRISASWRARNRLRDLADIGMAAGPGPGAGRGEVPEGLLGAVASAVAALDPGTRMGLSCFLDHPSERRIAALWGVSRHEARRRLVDAMATIATRLERPEAVEGRDWRVALCLWREGRTVEESAAWLGVTEAEVRASRARVHGAMARALGSIRGSGNAGARRTVMGRDLKDLLARALADAGDRAAWEELRARRQELLEEPGAGDPWDGLEDAGTAADPEALASLYGLLGESGVATAEGTTDETALALSLEFEEDEAGIGRAFVECLCPVGAPDHVLDLAGRLEKAGVGPVGSDLLEELRGGPDVRIDGRRLEPIVRLGVTPLSVHGTLDCLSALLGRVGREGLVPPGGAHALRLSSADGLTCEGTDFRVSAADLTRYIALHAPTLDERTAAGLLDWAVHMGGLKPFLIQDFRASAARESVVLEALPFAKRAGHDPMDNLRHRWSVEGGGAIRPARTPLEKPVEALPSSVRDHARVPIQEVREAIERLRSGGKEPGEVAEVEEGKGEEAGAQDLPLGG